MNQPARKRKKGELTRDSILDVAEELFAAHGFDGVPTRRIATEAGISPGVLSYHYPAKESLFEAVVVRRAEELNALRRAEIERLPTITLEGLLEAFFSPFMSKIEEGGNGWKYYAQILAHVAQEARWAPLAGGLFAESARGYIALMREIVPGLVEDDALRAYVHLVSVMVGFFAATGLLDSFSQGRLRSDDFRANYKTTISFVAGGIRALV